MHIGIAGNIGSGKTTLTRMLAAHYGWTPKYESVTYNPYLEDYYKDIPAGRTIWRHISSPRGSRTCWR